MPKPTIRPTRPSFRKTTVRKAVAEHRSAERKVQQRKTEIKEKAVSLLQKKSEEAAHIQRTSFAARKPDPVEQYRESRQDRFISALSANLNVMIQAVQKAGRGLARDFGELENCRFPKKAPRILLRRPI